MRVLESGSLPERPSLMQRLSAPLSSLGNTTDQCRPHREDDANWPKKNIVGKQELEIRLGSDHIAFEVRAENVSLLYFFLSIVACSYDSNLGSRFCRPPRSARWSTCRIVKIPRGFACSITWSRTSR